MYLSAKTTLVSRSLFSLLVILVASSALDASIFVQIPGIEGDSTDKAHESWIASESIHFGVKRPASSGGRTASGSPAFSEITLVRQADSSSPDFFIRAANGDIEPEAVIELSINGFVYLRVALKRVGVTGYSVSASDESITEQVTLSFSEISMTYLLPNPDGKADLSYTRSWSLEQNREF